MPAGDKTIGTGGGEEGTIVGKGETFTCLTGVGSLPTSLCTLRKGGSSLVGVSFSLADGFPVPPRPIGFRAVGVLAGGGEL